MSSINETLIAVVGATGQQGGAVVRSLKAGGRFKVRALSRHPGQHRGLGDEVAEADLNRPETVKAAFGSAHGVFLVTNFWEQGADEVKQATAAVRAAKDAGVRHLVWSTLPNVEAISRAKFNVPHSPARPRLIGSSRKPDSCITRFDVGSTEFPGSCAAAMRSTAGERSADGQRP
jgi:nucleoside-diphosphate-sugar epimerase